MNVGLNTRVIDQIGLANPMAAHTARLEDGRIGHDKNLFPDWAVAEGPWLKERPWVPEYLDEGWIEQAEVALDCPQTEEMLKSIRDPMTRPRFIGEPQPRLGVHPLSHRPGARGTNCGAAVWPCRSRTSRPIPASRRRALIVS